MIPTRGRPKLLLRALDSVLNQTFRDIEVIVVVDGPDDDTVAALRSVADPRLRTVVNPRSLTAAGARNAGVDLATGAWIAFLDDDDEWLPDKLTRQLALAQGKGAVLVSCRSAVITPLATYTWPAVIYDNSRPIDEYLFDRQSLFMGSSFIQTSSYLMPRALYQQSPFRLGMPHDDWDFLLHQSKRVGVRVETVPDVLVRHYYEERRPSLSRVNSWQASLAWLDSVEALFTPRAYSGFCLGVVGPRAANERDYRAFLPLLWRAVRHGAPRAAHVMAFLAFWLVPQGLRKRLRAALRGRRAG